MAAEKDLSVVAREAVAEIDRLSEVDHGAASAWVPEAAVGIIEAALRDAASRAASGIARAHAALDAIERELVVPRHPAGLSLVERIEALGSEALCAREGERRWAARCDVFLDRAPGEEAPFWNRVLASRLRMRLDIMRERGLESVGISRLVAADIVRALIEDPRSLVPAGTFQARTREHIDLVAGDDATDLAERRDRHAEEDAELLQALGLTREGHHRIVDYVHDRPVGEPAQEMGGTLHTLAALASYAGLDMMACGEAELVRCWSPEVIAKIRRKRANRHGRGVLPGDDADLVIEATP